MSTQINVIVGGAGLSAAAKLQTQANRQTKLNADKRQQVGAEGRNQRDAARAQNGLGANGKPLNTITPGVGRRLDEPAAVRRGGQLEFVLPPGLTFNPAIVGPFAAGVMRPDHNVFFGGNEIVSPATGAILAKTKNYGNSYVSSAIFLGVLDTNVNASPVTAADGSYEGGSVSQTGDTGTIFGSVTLTNSLLYLNHTILNGTSQGTINTLISINNGFDTVGSHFKSYQSGNYLRQVPGRSEDKGLTVECLIRLAAFQPMLFGISTFTISICGTKAPVYEPVNAGFLPYLNFELTLQTTFNPDTSEYVYYDSTNYSLVEADALRLLLHGGYNHFAAVLGNELNENGLTIVNYYINGQFIGAGQTYTYSSESERLTGQERLLDFELYIEDHVVGTSKSSLNGVRVTQRALYSGSSFTPPTELTSFA